ncbi:MAG: HAD-IIA family hydrolase [Acidimicrobiaceae bacterium]|nr:HAD-IIA family hydrolase [Acidimicrobiaceae bacterium]
MNWILDLDGVVWRGNQAVEGSSEAISRLGALGQSVFFVTNNSLLTPAEYVVKMQSFGIVAEVEQIFTSGMAAASLLEPDDRVFIIGGGNGLREAVQERGIQLVDDPDQVDAVVLGWDPGINFDKITVAMRAIRGGARYIATNADPTYPNPEGLLPGTGSLAAAVATASGAEPLVAGKPYPAIVSLIKPFLSGDDVMVGDRLTTDGQFARVLGVHFGLVLTGVNEPFRPSDVAKSTTIARDLLSLVAIFEEHASLPDGNYT